MISSEDAQRRYIYIQQPTIAASGHSSQAFNTHFPHTVRTAETRACGDCHLTAADDNNAINDLYGTTGPVCLARNAACTSNSQCCSNNCRIRRNQSVGSCR